VYKNDIHLFYVKSLTMNSSGTKTKGTVALLSLLS